MGPPFLVDAPFERQRMDGAELGKQMQFKQMQFKEECLCLPGRW